MEARLWWTSVTALVLFFLLGLLVSHAPLTRIDVEASALRGVWTPAAIVFTESGRWLWLLLVGLIGVLAGIFLRIPLWLTGGIIVSQSVSQGVIELLKHFFHRKRPDEWLFHHELGYSFPSGHAATAIVFFGAWLLVIESLAIPRTAKLTLCLVLALWMLGIDFSRIALGAHYLTDVVGGTLFGVFWLSASLALLAHFGWLPKAQGV